MIFEEWGMLTMNRQQRRKAEREAKKDYTTLRNTLTNDKTMAQNERIIRASFSDGQIYNNHEWAVRLERIREVKGIGPKMLDRIFKALEEPLNQTERQKARKTYESGLDRR